MTALLYAAWLLIRKEDTMEIPRTYSKGQKFVREYVTGARELYVLAVTGVDPDGKAEMNLICVKDGDRWATPVLADKCTAMTMEEFAPLMREGTFFPVDVGPVEVTWVTYKTAKVHI
jgi:hypothetical protein